MNEDLRTILDDVSIARKTVRRKAMAEFNEATGIITEVSDALTHEDGYDILKSKLIDLCGKMEECLDSLSEVESDLDDLEEYIDELDSPSEDNE